MAKLASENEDVRHHPIAPRDVIERLRVPVVRQRAAVRPLVAQLPGRQIAHAGGGLHLGVEVAASVRERSRNEPAALLVKHLKLFLNLVKESVEAAVEFLGLWSWF